ncbi:uncharacterized protein CDAR_32081 [Caerostris darwini]|uniref:Uncharacterized protein n=1 Tax=Caerostris darwini TaxID=1538125 RepID=A0AAV4RQ93_9ARAC|nr:uncharacterized protein CDAR_32081 [Caerostris darwini]
MDTTIAQDIKLDLCKTSSNQEAAMRTADKSNRIGWLIAAACGCVNFLTMVPTKLSGLFFVEILARYNTTRDLAAYPLFISILVRCSGGPLTGYFGERFGITAVVITGCVLTSVGVGACFFVEDIASVIVCLGIIHGLGISFTNTLIPQILKMYFDKNITLAYGLSQAGTCLGTFIAAPLITGLFRSYGASGAFLISGGIILNSLPFAMLFKIFSSEKKNGKSQTPCKELLETVANSDNKVTLVLSNVDENIVNGKQSVTVTKEKSKKLINPQYTNSDTLINSDMQKGNMNSHESPVTDTTRLSSGHQPNDMLLYKDISSLNFNETVFIKPNNTEKSLDNASFSDTCEKQHVTLIPNKEEVSRQDFPETFVNSCQYSQRSRSTPDEKDTMNKEKQLEVKTTDLEVTKKKATTTWQSMSIFLDATYLVLLVTQSVHIFVVMTVWTTMIDFSRDKSIVRSNEVYLLMILPVSEMVGRLCLAWITDKHYLTKTNFCIIFFVLNGLTCSVLAWVQSFAMMMVGVVALGVISSGLIIVFPFLVFEFFEKDKQTMGVASRYFLFGPLSFGSGPFIAFFRNKLGSYNWLYHTLNLLCISCAVLAAVVPALARRRDKKKEINTS